MARISWSSIRNDFKNNVSIVAVLADIETRLKLPKTDYKFRWIEMAWIEENAKKGKSVREIFDYVNNNRLVFQYQWTIKKISKIVSKFAPVIIETPSEKLDTTKTYFNEERTYGVEIEFIRPLLLDYNKIRNALAANNIDANIGDRCDYSKKNYWKLTHDGSVHVGFGEVDLYAGQNEIVSPVLKGKAGLEQIKRVLSVLKSLGCKVNHTCGLHVHHGFLEHKENDIESLGLISKSIKNTCLIYSHYFRKLSKIMKKERASNSFCRNFTKRELSKLKLEYTKKPELYNDDDDYSMRLAFCRDRRKAVNPTSWFRHKTIEFRQYEGTLDETKTLNWIVLTQKLLEKGVEYTIKDINLLAHSFDNIFRELDLNKDMKVWYKQQELEHKTGNLDG